MKRKEAETKIGTRVYAWKVANGTYFGKLVEVIPGKKWRGIVEIDGVVTPAHHFEFGRVVRRGFRPGERIEVGGVNITFDVLTETGIIVSALPLWHDDLDHPERAKNPALIRNIQRDGIRL